MSPAANGSYDFGEFATQDGYVVRLDAPATCAVVGAAERTVSNRGNDGDPASRADFAVRAIIPQPISGTVRDAGGAPVPGVQVTLDAARWWNGHDHDRRGRDLPLRRQPGR